MEKTMIEALAKKQMFVNRVASAICGQDRIPVEEIHYEVWEHPDGWCEEWLKIVYKGGAHAIRSVNATSELGIFEEIGRGKKKDHGLLGKSRCIVCWGEK